MLHSSLERANVRVMRRGSTYFLSDRGRVGPVSRETIARRFGEPFARAVDEMRATWVEFDAAEQSRIECNRARFEVVGLAFKFDFDGTRLYGIWDHGLNRLLPGGMSRSYDCSHDWIDCISPEHLEAYERMEPTVIAAAVYLPGSAHRIARHNAHAVDLIANLLDAGGSRAAGS
jgi:hypothetical protein